MSTARVSLPPKLIPVFSKPRGAVQYRGAWGGRGSGKSFNFAKMAAIWGVVEPLRILCTRELQVSIKESFHAELKAAITSEPWLEAAYDVGVDYLRSRINGTEFLFRGLYRNLGAIKSMAKIDLTIVEEAEDVSEDAWTSLEATVLRQPKSEIWPIWNPKDEGSPVDKRFRAHPDDPSMLIVEMNWTDNPWFPEGLRALRDRQKRTMDDPTYQWIWEGKYLTASKAVIFADKWVEGELHVTDAWNGPYYGLDFGFSQDPTAGVKCWISPDEDVLYIEHEAGKVGLELDDTAKFLIERLPGIEHHTVYADNARPESISHLKRADPHRRRPNLPNIEPVEKGPGSVEDGIAHAKSFVQIVVHPRCTGVLFEMRNYKYKVDRLTGDVLATIVDKNNHYIDALRYALERVMKAKNEGVGMLLGSRRFGGR